MMTTIIKWALAALLLSLVLSIIPGAYAPVVGGMSIASILQGLLGLELVGTVVLAVRDLCQDPDARNAVVVKTSAAAQRLSGFRSAQAVMWVWGELFPSKPKVTTNP